MHIHIGIPIKSHNPTHILSSVIYSKLIIPNTVCVCFTRVRKYTLR